MLGEETHIHLYLVPKAFDLVVVLSGVTIMAGAVIFYLTYYSSPYFWQRTAEPIREWVEYAPQKGYNFLVDGMQWLANWQTRFLQSGYLRYYLSIIIGTTLLLAGSALLSRVEFGSLWWPRAYIHEWIVAAMIIVGAAFTVQARSRLSAVIGLGVVGYGVAVVFILKSAPDLAMTQFAIETLSVVLFVLVVYRLPGFANVSSSFTRLRDGVLASLAGALMTMLLLATTSQPAEDRLTPYFAENSYTLAHGRNVVNVILVDFRALDTMGEITVIGIGAIGIYTLMKLRPDDAPPHPPTHKEKER
jgi:multicomponent Na+:H+ antiporter subunit A